MRSRYIWDRYSLAGGDYHYIAADGTAKSGSTTFYVEPNEFPQGPASIVNGDNMRATIGDDGARCLFDPSTGLFSIIPNRTLEVGQSGLPISLSGSKFAYDPRDNYGRDTVYYSAQGLRCEDNSYGYGWILKPIGGGRLGKLQPKRGPIKGNPAGNVSGPSQAPFLQVFFLHFSPLQHPLW